MDIEHWRREIDEVDGELLRLLNIRARLAIKVGTLKRATGLPLRDLDREHSVVDRLSKRTRDHSIKERWPDSFVVLCASRAASKRLRRNSRTDRTWEAPVIRQN
jgi:chorismate mutase